MLKGVTERQNVEACLLSSIKVSVNSTYESDQVTRSPGRTGVWDDSSIPKDALSRRF